MAFLIDLLGALLVVAGMPFFFAGTLGMLRFPDVYTRLHALTKADNLGLGMVALGLALQASSWRIAVKILLIWLLVMLASAAACHIVARLALHQGLKPWKKVQS